MKTIISIILLLSMYGCKEKKRESYFPDLSVMARPAPMLPISSTTYYSIEEKKLDTAIMLLRILKEQNKILIKRNKSLKKALSNIKN